MRKPAEGDSPRNLGLLANVSGLEGDRSLPDQQGPVRALTAAGITAALAVAVFGVLVMVGSAVVVSRLMDSDSGPATLDSPSVGADLHVVSFLSKAVYVGGQSGVARSLDGGRTWRPVEGLRGSDAMAIMQTRTDLLVGGHGGLFRSTDGGLNFALAQGGRAPKDVHAGGTNGVTAYVASPQDGLLRSDDGGQTWADVNHGDAQRLVGTIAVDATDSGILIAIDPSRGIVRSMNGGATWTAVGRKSVAALAVDPQDFNIMVVLGPDGAARSQDGGRTWDPLNAPTASSTLAYVESGWLAAVGKVGGRVLTYQSRDQGATWQTGLRDTTLAGAGTSPS